MCRSPDNAGDAQVLELGGSSLSHWPTQTPLPISPCLRSR